MSLSSLFAVVCTSRFPLSLHLFITEVNNFLIDIGVLIHPYFFVILESQQLLHFGFCYCAIIFESMIRNFSLTTWRFVSDLISMECPLLRLLISSFFKWGDYWQYCGSVLSSSFYSICFISDDYLLSVSFGSSFCESVQ